MVTVVRCNNLVRCHHCRRFEPVSSLSISRIRRLHGRILSCIRKNCLATVFECFDEDLLELSHPLIPYTVLVPAVQIGRDGL
jgi:hypothetical protein